MRVAHPYARRDTVPPSAVTVNGDDYQIDSDGVVEAPADVARTLADGWARAYDCDSDDLLVAETCDAVKSDGEVCGRERPCRYHDEADT